MCLRSLGVGVKGAERSVFDLAHSDPGAAAADATRALAEDGLDDAARTQLLWVRGLARREMGLLTEARSDLELAMVLADERALVAQIAVTLSLVLMYIGDTPGALWNCSTGTRTISGRGSRPPRSATSIAAPPSRPPR